LWRNKKFKRRETAQSQNGDCFAPLVAVYAFEKGCSPKELACAGRSVTLAKFGHIPENTLACFCRFFSSTRVVFAAGVLLFLCRSALEKTEFFFEKMLFYFSCSVYNSTESQDKDCGGRRRSHASCGTT
jgi:hypothetical protein